MITVFADSLFLSHYYLLKNCYETVMRGTSRAALSSSRLHDDRRTSKNVEIIPAYEANCVPTNISSNFRNSINTHLAYNFNLNAFRLEE